MKVKLIMPEIGQESDPKSDSEPENEANNESGKDDDKAVLSYQAENPETITVSGIISVRNERITKDTKFKSRRVKRLYDWWFSFAPSKPLYSSFDIINHLHDAPSIFLFKVHSPDEIEIRLNGEEATKILGKTYTGIFINKETTATDPHLANLHSYLNYICDYQTPMLCQGQFLDTIKRVRNFQSIDCPLFDDKGKVSHILGTIEAI